VTEKSELERIAAEKILILDGAMGTSIQKFNLSAEDFGGAALEGCNENLLLTKPSVIAAIHDGYFEAGADIVETNTFGSTPLVLAEYGLQDKAFEISKAGAALAKASAKKYSTSKKPRFVAGSMGPTTRSYFVTRNVTFEQLVESFKVQATGLLEGGADLLLVETCQDTINVKAALIGIDQAFAETGMKVPVSVSTTIELMGTMLAGQGVEALYYALQQRDLFSIGLNCATGPDFMTDHVRTLSEISRFAVACVPNAGLPDEEGRYNETPNMIAQKLERFVDSGWVNVLGGCCGTVAEHIKLISQMAEGKKPRTTRGAPRFSLSGIEPLVIDEDKRPVIVGERTNVIGSRKFKQLIVDGQFEEASEIGRKQVKSGAQIVDVCLANPDRDEKADTETFLDFITRKVKVPLMIDSTDAAVIESSLKKCMGRSVINSINLEDGEERFEKVVPLAKRYGAAVIVGCIDENKKQGMAVERQRKLAIAQRSHKLLTEKYGLIDEDLLFDPLVFPIATGDVNYIGSAEETIEGIRLIKKALPRCKTVLGISNVSFGLPEAGREVLNSVFLYHCVQAGLDVALVNSEKLARYAGIPAEEKKLADDLLFSTKQTSEAAVAAFANHFRTKQATKKTDNRAAMPIDVRLPRNVIEGSKEGLIEDLETLRKSGQTPLAIINGPLMKGMDEVGRLFNNNEMIVAEVLQSAEVMKAAVAHLEQFMDKDESAGRGKVILATVKGDVHDIGKNLVHIILKNNGYQVVDLGIKVPPEDLIKAIKEHQPDMVGLSGLLVKSAQQMVVTADDLRAAGVDLPILVGGAALSEKFTASKIAVSYGKTVIYAKDAMSGLDLANRLMDPMGREELLKKNDEVQNRLRSAGLAPAAAPARAASAAAAVKRDYDPPKPPDLKVHTLENFSLDDIFKYVNPVMLYGKHLGLRGQLQKLLQNKDARAMELHGKVTELQDEIVKRKYMNARAIWRFLPAQSEGDRVLVYDSPAGGKVLTTFDFPRQKTGEGLSLADYVLPKSGGKMDYIATFIVTTGDRVKEISADYREKGEYFRSHAIQAVAIESAEGFAELLHDRIRTMWGIADPAGMTIQEKLQTKYRGIRVSFGYPACPNMEDQTKLFELLDPRRIGVELTENFMMEPEASVSAIVFHHPQAHYFSVLEAGGSPELASS
jgi:5-methyltetrahydrofolate--homocysteine methyltransferase